MPMPKTILIVEDEEDLSQALSDELFHAKYDVLVAKNGQEGLRIALKNHPDLILLDIVMPEMDGMTVLKKLRADSWGKKAPVIMLTNLSATDKILQGVAENEPSYYMIKSDWKIADIVARIHEQLYPKIKA
jgi:DNA-binding response OmpR family regulator